MQPLKDKVALITGAAMGMGRATAERFAASGASVMLADLDEAQASHVARCIEAAGGQAVAIRCDVSDESQVEAMMAATVERFGRIDCAVNNAATASDNRPIAEADLDQFDRIIAVNLRGVMACLKHELRQMATQASGGAIVNISSVSGQRPRANNAAYVASKHGVIGLTKTASLEYAPLGIRVNAVLPGVIDTPMVRETMARTGSSETEVAGALSLFGRFGRPEEVAEASLWLCSDAASFVTGHSLAVDAGYLAR